MKTRLKQANSGNAARSAGMMMKQLLRMNMNEGSQIDVLTEEKGDTFYPTMLRIRDIVSNEVVEVWCTNDEVSHLAHVLLAAAGEPQYPDATSPHTFVIGDAVETNDGIHGHVEDFIDAEVLIRTDRDLLLKRHITDIEYVDDHDTAAEAK